MIGEKLKRARNAAKLSLRDLAEMVNVSQTTISKYEKELAKPNSEMIRDLAKALNIKQKYFFGTEKLVLKNKEYRKRDTSSKQLASIESKILDNIESRFFVETFFRDEIVPKFTSPLVGYNKINYLKDVPQIAQELRNAWNINNESISDLCELFESKGIKVFMIDEPKESSFDGLTAIVEGYNIIVISSDWPGDRQRFTLAHELGHLILKNMLSENLIPKEERACDYFAGSFLLPAHPLLKILGYKRTSLEIAELSLLKKEFGVSMQAAFIRASQEKIISYAYSSALWKQFEKEGWNIKEPGEAYPSEKIYIFERFIIRAFSEGHIEESKAAELMGLTIRKFRLYRQTGY